MANEIADTGQREVALKEGRELKHLAQVEQSARAPVALRSQLGPAHVAALLQQTVEDVGHRERIAKPAEPVSDLDQLCGLGGDALLHLRVALAPRLLQTVTQAHAPLPGTPLREPVQGAVGHADDRSLQHTHQRAVVHGVLGQAEKGEHVLDLLAVEKAGPSAGQVRDALTSELILELTREHAHRVREDGDVREPAPRPVQAADRLGHGARLRPRVRRHHDSDWSAAAAPRGDEVGLGREVAVAADEVGGAVENLLE